MCFHCLSTHLHHFLKGYFICDSCEYTLCLLCAASQVASPEAFAAEANGLLKLIAEEAPLLHIAALASPNALHQLLSSERFSDERYDLNAVDAHNESVLFYVIGKPATSANLIRRLTQSGADIRSVNSAGQTALSKAATDGDLPAVRVLLDLKADKEHRDLAGRTPLLLAAAAGQLSVAMHLVKNKAKKNHSDDDGRTAIFLAAEHGHLHLLRSMFEEKKFEAVDATKAAKDGQTPLIAAALAGDLESATFLADLLKDKGPKSKATLAAQGVLYAAVARGEVDLVERIVTEGVVTNTGAVQVDLTDAFSGWSYARIAAARGNQQVLRFLAGWGVDMKVAIDPDGITPLEAALGHPSAVAALLEQGGCSADAVDREGVPLVLRALEAEGGKFCDSARVLIQHGADLNCVGPPPRGTTPLLSAIRSGQMTVASELVEKGCNLEVASLDDGMSPLLLAVDMYCISGDNIYFRFVCDLLDRGVSKDAQDSNGSTALHRAVRSASQPLFDLLIDAPIAKLDTPDKSGKTAVHWAAASSSPYAAKMLSELRNEEADFMTIDADGRTALHIAAAAGMLAIVDDLKDHVDVDAKDKHGATALYLAAERGHEEVVNVLIELGCDFIQPSAEGKTPLMIAWEKGFNGIAVVLEDAGAKGLATGTGMSAVRALSQSQSQSLPAKRNLNFVQDYLNPVKPIDWVELKIDSGKPIGQGSFGHVFRGKWRQRQGLIDVAVKVLSRAVADAKDFDYDDMLIKGKEEAELVHSVSARSPWFADCITFVYGFAEGGLPPSLLKPFRGSAGDEAFGIVMRLEESGALDDLLYKRPAPRSLTENIRIITGVSRGLAALHSLNVVHGDMKPGNVLLSGHKPPEVRLSDFGLSAYRDAGDGSLGGSVMHMTSTGTRGTLVYCAPEMLDAEDGSGNVARASRSTDVYALAVMTWEILSGQLPFDNMKTPLALSTAVVRDGTRPPLDKLPVDTPKHIRQMIADCWDKDRSRRWAASDCFAALSHEYERLASKDFDIFFSHRWASKPFLSHVYSLLCEQGFRVWYDVNEMGYDLDKSMRDGVQNSTVVLACVDPEYQRRPNCMLELRHAHKCVTEELGQHRTKAILGVMMQDGVGWGENWGTDELQDILNTQGKMFVQLHELGNLPGWGDQESSIEELVQKLRGHEQVQLLLKILGEVLKVED